MADSQFTWDYPSSKPQAAPAAPTEEFSYDYQKSTPKKADTLGEKILGVPTNSVFKTFFGKDFSDVYDKVKQHLPKEFDDTWAGRFMVSLGEGGPEMLNAASSPLGLGLIAAHFYPRTKPIAAAADTVLGLMQAGRTVNSIAEAGKDPSPEHMAAAIKDAFFTYRIVKAKAITGFKAKNLENRPEALKHLSKLKEQAPAPGDTKKVLQAKRQAQAAIWEDARTIRSNFEGYMAKAYQTPGVNILARIMDAPRPKILEMGQAMIDEHQAFTSTEETRLRRLLFKLDEVPKEDRDIRKLGYVIEGDLTPDEAGLSPKARAILPEIRQFNEDAVDAWHRIYGPDVKLHDAATYLAHSWDPESIWGEGPKKAERPIRPRGRSTRDPFMGKRTTTSWKEGIEENGWLPKSWDVKDIIESRYRAGINAASNFRMAKTLSNIGAIVGEGKARKSPGLYGRWPILDSSVLHRAVFRGKKTIKINKVSGKTTEGIQFDIRPVRVHPDIKMAVEAIFGDPKATQDPYTGKLTGWGQYERVGSMMKQSILMSSLFHNWSISFQEQALRAGYAKTPKDFGKLAKSWFFFNGDFYRGARSGIWEAFGKRSGDAPPLMRMKPAEIYPWLEAGYRPPYATADRETALIKWLNGLDLEKGNPLIRGGKTALKMFGKVSQTYDRALFEYYLPSAQMGAMESIYQSELARNPGMSPEAAAKLRQSIATHTNKAFGTESMERMLFSPQARKVMYRMLLAPQWTLSNIRILTGGYENETRKRLRDRYIIGAALSWFIGTQLMNYATTGWDAKDAQGNHTWQGRFSWNNPGAPLSIAGKEQPDVSENVTNIYLGKGPDGQDRYAMPFRAFSDAIKWLFHPDQALGGKLAPLPKLAITTLTGAEPGSGYQVWKPGMKPKEQAVNALFDALGSVTPIWSEDAEAQLKRKLIPEVTPEPGGARQVFSMPTFRGLTKTRAIEVYTESQDEAREARNKGDGAAEIRAQVKAKKILTTARSMGINPNSIVSAWRADFSKRRKTAMGPRLVVTAPPPE